MALWSKTAGDESQEAFTAAVARVLVLSTALGRRPPSEDTAGSCRARAQGPARVLQRLTDQASDRLELDVPQAWLGHRHRSYA